MTLTWTERYSTHAAQVGQIGEILCVWNPGYTKNDPRPSGYRVSFCGVALKHIIPDLDMAQAAGIALAQRKLREALIEVTE